MFGSRWINAARDRSRALLKKKKHSKESDVFVLHKGPRHCCRLKWINQVRASCTPTSLHKVLSLWILYMSGFLMWANWFAFNLKPLKADARFGRAKQNFEHNRFLYSESREVNISDAFSPLSCEVVLVQRTPNGGCDFDASKAPWKFLKKMFLSQIEFVNLQISEMDFGGQSQKYNTIFFGWYYKPDMQSSCSKKHYKACEQHI